MKRIASSIAVLALAAVFAGAQETQKVDVITKDGKTTITVNGKIVKVIEGDLKGEKIVVDGKTIVVTGVSNPVVVDGKKIVVTKDSKVIVTDKGKVYEHVLVPGKQPLVVYRTAPQGQTGADHYRVGRESGVIVDPSVFTIQDGGRTRVVKGVEVRQDNSDEAKIQELHKRIEALHRELGELMKKRHGGDPGQKKLMIEKAESIKVDAAKIKEMGLKMAEQGKMFRELAVKEHGGLMKLKELEGMKMLDEKRHKQLMEQLHKEMAGQHQLNEKQHLELMKKLEKGHKLEMADEQRHLELMKKLEKDLPKGQKLDFTFNEKNMQMFEKMDPKMMEKLHQEMAGMGQKFEFKFDDKEMQRFKEMGQDGGMFYRMEGKDGKFTLVPGAPGRVRIMKGDEGQEPAKRFFDEPFFQTPGPAKKSKSKKKAYKVVTSPQTKMTRVLAPAQIARAEALKEMRVTAPKVALESIRVNQAARAEALKGLTVIRPEIALEAAKAGQIARTQALKESAVARGEWVRTAPQGASTESALRAKIAALEEAIRALKEENAKLKEKKTPPPAPKVSVTSRRVR